jgi:hypothetical protein
VKNLNASNQSTVSPNPGVLAEEIVFELAAAYEQFREIGQFSCKPTTLAGLRVHTV